MLPLGLFLLILLFTIVRGGELIYALLLGWLVFVVYGIGKKQPVGRLLKLSWQGLGMVLPILTTFVLIGMLTALWRASGTIAAIVSPLSRLIHPSTAALMAFVLCALVSFLTGTSFGTVATMGVISLTVARAMGLDEALVGGAVMSGIYIGDRAGPTSTSALLVSQITSTDLYGNLKRMWKASLVPIGITLLVYLLAGRSTASSSGELDVTGLLGREFRLGWVPLLPALVLLFLAFLKQPVKRVLAASACTALLVWCFYQKGSFSALPRLLVFGFTAEDAEVGRMLSGGGIVSMVRSGLIVGISSTYAPLLEAQGLLDGLHGQIAHLAGKVGRSATGILAGLLGVVIGCNQTLGVMLATLLVKPLYPDKEELALLLEDSVIVLAGLIPWSIASAVPLETIGCSLSALPWAVYLYLLPLWHLLSARRSA